MYHTVKGDLLVMDEELAELFVEQAKRMRRLRVDSSIEWRCSLKSQDQFRLSIAVSQLWRR